MKNMCKVSLIFLSLFTFNVSADIYIGGGIYTSEIDETLDSINIDDSDTVPAIFVGWKPMKFLAIELGYYDLGEYSTNLFTGDATAYTLGVVANVPLWVLDVYAKGGLAVVDYDLPLNTESESESDPYYGVGAAINLGSSIDLYAEYLVFDSGINVDMIGVGIKFQF